MKFIIETDTTGRKESRGFTYQQNQRKHEKNDSDY